MWIPLALTLFTGGYGGQDACYDLEHVLRNTPMIAEKRQLLAERFFPRRDQIEEKKRRLAELQAGLDAAAGSPTELEQSIWELDEEIQAEEAAVRADLDEAIAVEKKDVDAYFLEKSNELKEILDIGELRRGCLEGEIVTDVTDALLALIRGEPIK